MTKTFFLIFILFITCINSYSQKKKKVVEITNVISENHSVAIGSKCSLIPPPEFTQATSFSGFQQIETNSSIMIIEIPSPFKDISIGMTKEGLLTKGIKLDFKETFIINGYEAVLIHAEQSAYGTTFLKLILIFGDDDNSIMVNAVCLEKPKKLISEIEKSILSVVYDTNEVINPLNSVRFSVDVSGTKFKIGSLFSGSLLYTVDGNVPTESEDKSNLIIGASIGKVEIGNPKEFSKSRMRQLPTISEINDDNINEITIDNMIGYEIVSYGKDDKTNNPEMVYQLTLFDEDEYYMLVGSAKDNFEENLKAFKKISKTFKRK